MEIKINNRRYIGAKTSLLNEIESAINENYNSSNFCLADIFAGTGVVANHFSDSSHKVIVNDLLYSNFVAYQAWMGNGYYDFKKISNILDDWNTINVKNISNNYFSNTYSDKYYSVEDAKLIGEIRDRLSLMKSELTEREYYILLTSLLYEADRIANTCGHFESFLNKKPITKGVNLKVPIIQKHNYENDIYCCDANELVRNIKADIFYIDPPYNARQYINFYHVLENLARWDKPIEFEGNSMKFKRNHLKSDYSKSKAPIVFDDLIENINGKLIIVSYNNTYNAKSSASNNKILESQIISSLEKRGPITKKEINYKFFNAGKTDFDNHKEILFICKVLT